MSGESCCIFFFFNDTATTEIYTLSLHDALPISLTASTARKKRPWMAGHSFTPMAPRTTGRASTTLADRKSTRLNSSHSQISYAVFCLKKKKIIHDPRYVHHSTEALETAYCKSNH